jgi:outer membrane protein TolC
MTGVRQCSSGVWPGARKWIAAGLCFVWPVSFLLAQQESIIPVRPSGPILWRPYFPPEVPPVRLKNSGRLHDLIRAGKLYLTLRGAIALALENNVDVEVARYNPILSEWRLERAQAGGALPGVPSASSQVSAVASGQGVLGSQQAAGVSGGGATTPTKTAGNATITQIGPITQTLDPSVQATSTVSHQTAPQPNSVQSLTSVLIQNRRNYSASLQEGFLSGGSVTMAYNNAYLRENAPTDVLNPSSLPSIAISFQHNLLQGFGVAVNGRTITVAKMNLQTSDLNFKSQVIDTVVTVVNTYHSLVADYEDVTAKRSAVEVAQKLYDDTRKQLEIGTLADIEVTRAESQVASSRQNLVNSETSLRQHELQLKNLISRNGIEDSLLANAQIVPLDRIDVAASDDLPSPRVLAEKALANRSDLTAERANLAAAEVSALGTKNGVLPVLVGFGSTTQRGLSGEAHTVYTLTGVEVPNPLFVGGIGNALGQVLRRDFASNMAGVFFSAPIHNRQAQSDQGIDQLSLRQTELANRKDLKQAEVDVLNSVVAVRQARARYDAAVKNKILAERLLDAEQKKFALGASTPYNVIQQQRDLATAQSAEIAALVTQSNARVSLDRTLGTILDTYQISIADARAGKVAQTTALPAALPNRP